MTNISNFNNNLNSIPPKMNNNQKNETRNKMNVKDEDNKRK